MNYYFSDGRGDSSSSSRSRCHYPPPLPPIRNTVRHSGSGGNVITTSRFRIPNSYNEAMCKRARSSSSGCFLDTIEPDTPTPPPPPIVSVQFPPGGTLPRPRSTGSGGFWQTKPKYKFNRIENPVMDYTSAGSPPLTPPSSSIPTPPPPPPHMSTSKSLKTSHFGGGYKNKPNHML